MLDQNKFLKYCMRIHNIAYIIILLHTFVNRNNIQLQTGMS